MLITFRNLAVVGLICLFNMACAEVLTFKPGDQASYRIFQKVQSEAEVLNELISIDSKAVLDLEITILSSNRKTLSYPFDVEVILKRISIHQVEKNNDDMITTNYDSNNMRTTHPALASFFLELIGYPLRFKIESEFQVMELGGYLEKLYERHNNAGEISFYGTAPWTFELFLAQLFHLSGKNLILNKTYPLSCYRLLNWDEDHPLIEKNLKVLESGAYSINSVDDKHIGASWKAKASVSDAHLDLNAHVSTQGDVTWNIDNPLIQTRKWTAEIEESFHGYIPIHLKFNVQQQWNTAR